MMEGKMAGKRVNIADELVASLQEAADIMAGKVTPSRAWHPPAAVDVRAIRARTGLSQPNFAKRFGFSVGAVREWEQGRRRPEAAARVLLLIIASKPEVVDEVLAAAMPQAA
jgi:putative transcriptional regulator